MADFISGNYRDVDVSATITLRSGAQLVVQAGDVYSYSANGTASTSGIPIGEAVSYTFSLSVTAAACPYTAEELDGAEVRVRMGVRGDSASDYEYVDAGAWYVTGVGAPEASSAITLTGSDALNLYFDKTFSDNEAGYPITLGGLLSLVCAIPGVAVKSNNWLNSNTLIAKKPRWSDSVTLRSIVGYIAACAGGFAQIDPTGQLEIITAGRGSVMQITPEAYTSFTPTGGAKFSFNCLRVVFVPESEDETAADAVRFAIDGSIEDNATNCVAVENNPLYTEAIAASVRDALNDVEYSGAALSWLGDPQVCCGHTMQITALDGQQYKTLVTNRQLTFDGGLLMTCTSSMPTLYDTSAHYSSSGRLFNSDGTLPVTRISEFSGGVVDAMLGKFDRIVAGDITADSLGAKFVEAVQASVGHLDADSIDADVLKAGTVTAEKIASKTITADQLKAGLITADSGLIAVGAIQNAQIADGSITSAKIVELSADVIKSGTLMTDRLLLVGEGGVVYEINAASSGLSETELSDEKYQNYINGTVIVANSITAAQIAAGTITANEIAANAITAAKINVSDLFAAEATINAINAMDITGNSYLRLMVTDAVDGVRVGGRNYILGTGTPYTAVGDGTRKWYFPWECASTAMANSLMGQTVTISFDYSTQVTSGSLQMLISGVWTGVKTFDATESGHFSRTLDVGDSAIEDANFIYMDGTFTGSVTISRMKVELGNRATDWTPAPEDPAGGVKTSYIEIADDRIDVSSGGNVNIQAGGSLNVNSGSFDVVTGDFQMSLAKAEGTDVVMDIDDDGHTTFKAIHAGNVREAEYGYVYFTTATMGSMNALADWLKRTDARIAEYSMSADEYGNVTFDNYNGMIKITGNGHRLPGITLGYGFTGTLWIQDGYLTQQAENSWCLDAHGGKALLTNCWFTGSVTYGLHATHAAELRWMRGSSEGLQGYSLNPFIWTQYGGTAYYYGSIPDGGIWEDSGWIRASSTVNRISGSGGSAGNTTAASVTGTLGYYGSGNGWHAGECFQGYTGVKGRIYGCLSFDLSGVGTIQSAKLTLHRKSGVGLNRKANVTVYGTTASRGSNPANGMTGAYASGTELISWSGSATLDVTAAAQALKAGSIAQLVLYTGETGVYSGKVYSYHYAQFDSASLEVVYT